MHSVTMTAFGKTTFACDLCDLDGLSEEGIAHHFEAVHVKASPVKCLFCDLEGITPEDMTLHINTVHFGPDSDNPLTRDSSAVNREDNGEEQECMRKANEAESSKFTKGLVDRRSGIAGKRSAKMRDDDMSEVDSQRLRKPRTNGQKCERPAQAETNCELMPARLKIYSRIESTSKHATISNSRECSRSGLSACVALGDLKCVTCAHCADDESAMHLCHAHSHMTETNTMDCSDNLQPIYGVKDSDCHRDCCTGTACSALKFNTPEANDGVRPFVTDCVRTDHSETVSPTSGAMDEESHSQDGHDSTISGDSNCVSNSFACPVCEFEFNDPNQLAYHVERHFLTDKGT